MNTICIVEDDKVIREELQYLLEQNGYETVAVSDFTATVDTVCDSHADLVLLDLNLPHQDGILVCREVRSRLSIPIIVVTSRVGEVDEVMCMKMGADDFVAKPYSPHVLLARIEALLRRVQGSVAKSSISYKGIELNIASMEVSFEGQTAALTKNEMRILKMLMSKPKTCMSRQTIMYELWNSDEFIDDNTLTVNINRLRQTLKKIGVESLLVTHRGRGYSVE